MIVNKTDYFDKMENLVKESPKFEKKKRMMEFWVYLKKQDPENHLGLGPNKMYGFWVYLKKQDPENHLGLGPNKMYGFWKVCKIIARLFDLFCQ